MGMIGAKNHLLSELEELRPIFQQAGGDKALLEEMVEILTAKPSFVVMRHYNKIETEEARYLETECVLKRTETKTPWTGTKKQAAKLAKKFGGKAVRGDDFHAGGGVFARESVGSKYHWGLISYHRKLNSYCVSPDSVPNSHIPPAQAYEAWKKARKTGKPVEVWCEPEVDPFDPEDIPF